jgi:hypothetical protein
VTLEGSDSVTDRVLRQGEKEVGTLRSTLRLEERILGLAMIRREVEPGAALRAGNREVRVMSLPLDDGETRAVK